MKFKAQRPDGRSYRDVVVDAIKDKPPTTVITLDEFGTLLGLSPLNDAQKIRAAVRDALKPLLKLYKRGLESVPKVGYRLIEARDHVMVASRHQSKAGRAMSRALAFYEGTNMSQLSETERRLHNGQYILAQAIVASHKHLDRRISRIEELLSGEKAIE